MLDDEPREALACHLFKVTVDGERAAVEQRLLADVGKIMVDAGSDIERLLHEVAAAVASRVADWCRLDVDAEGDTRRVRFVHRDAGKLGVCQALERFAAVGERTARERPLLVADVGTPYLEAHAADEEHLRQLLALGVGSFVVVPLVARGQSLGTLSFGLSDRRRRYTTEDVELAERLASRLALAVDNARLHEALERAVKVRDEVLGMVAHDLRNPLNAIMLHAQTLRRRRGEPERRDVKALDSIHRAASRMDRLIQDLLDVSRLEGGQRLTIVPAVLRAGTILGEVVELHATSIARANREVRVVVEEGAEIWADRARIVQVLDNLLGNAAKFARRRITVGAVVRGDEVLFSVHDDGPGVAPSDLPHLFDPFWQGCAFDRRGAGLGLSIVRAIVDAHGGRVWAESAPDRGSTFLFALPRTRCTTRSG